MKPPGIVCVDFILVFAVVIVIALPNYGVTKDALSMSRRTRGWASVGVSITDQVFESESTIEGEGTPEPCKALRASALRDNVLDCGSPLSPLPL